jgi:hypothetical protein
MPSFLSNEPAELILPGASNSPSEFTSLVDAINWADYWFAQGYNYLILTKADSRYVVVAATLVQPMLAAGYRLLFSDN